MNLYLVTDPDARGYDVFDAVVVAADSDHEARLIHPSCVRKNWNGVAVDGSWPDADRLDVELIGNSSDKPHGVILASFNAG